MKQNRVAMLILGTLITVCFFALLGLLMFLAIPIANSELLYLAIGALIGFMGSVVQYYFGSSSGSADKSEQIANLKKQNDARE
jgi:lipopolysaccharide export LptBFGC system permease protein LptF